MSTDDPLASGFTHPFSAERLRREVDASRPTGAPEGPALPADLRTVRDRAIHVVAFEQARAGAPSSTVAITVVDALTTAGLLAADEPPAPLAVGETVGTAEQLHALPDGAVLRGGPQRLVMEKIDAAWWAVGNGRQVTAVEFLPARVLDLGGEPVFDSKGRGASYRRGFADGRIAQRAEGSGS